MATKPTPSVILKRKRGNIKGQLTKIANAINGEGISPRELELKSNTVQSLKIKLDELRNEGYSIIEDEDLEEFEDSITEVEIQLEALEVRLLDLLNPSTQLNSETLAANNNNSANNAQIKLPSIALPQFSGLYTEWLPFKAQFTTLIDENSSLTESQKLYYLQSSLTGSAKQLQNINDSYESLLDALKKRFENKRLIVNSHISELLSISKVRIESAREIRNLVDKLSSHLRALKQLGLERNNLSEAILMNIVLSKIDVQSRQSYEMTLDCNEIPNWDNFIEFLLKRSQALDNVPIHNAFASKPKQEFFSKQKSFVLQNDKNLCPLCNCNHMIYKCKRYLDLSVADRLNCIRKFQLCYNCLGTHKISLCKKLNNKCKTCLLNHHSTICKKVFHNSQIERSEINSSSNENVTTKNKTSFKEKDSLQIESGAKENETSLANFTLHESINNLFIQSSNVLLSTAIVYIKGINDSFFPFYAILDSASQVTLCSQEVCNILGTKHFNVNTSITGLNGSFCKVKKGITAEISNKDGTFQKTINMLVVPKITDLTPSRPIDISNLQLPENLKYANPEFHKPQRIQILLGGDIFYELLLNGQIKLNDSSVILQNSQLGWIVTGTLNNENHNTTFKCHLLENQWEFDLKRFWELEDIGIKDDPTSVDSVQVLEQFHETVTFKDNRYEITLPWIREWNILADNFNIAEKRLKGLIKRMRRDKTLFEQYREILDDYLDKNIIEHVQDSEKISDRPVFYLPHHTVLKQDSVYTKCRIVFDASSHEEGQLSLNDCLDSGHNLNPNIFHLLLHFRFNKIAMLADIEKAFLQISINPRDRDVLRFLFVNKNPADNENFSTLIYRFKRLTFGLNASPFLLSATIKEHVSKFQSEYPLATEVLNNFIYVDDIVTGTDTVQDALTISQDSHKIMLEAGMNLRKWISNSEPLMEMWKNLGFSILPQSSNESEKQLHKVLGIYWQPELDILVMNIDNLLDFLNNAKITKRIVLQAAGRIFDPLGLISPFTVRLKCLFQELWVRKVSWDEDLPPDIANIWKGWISELPLLHKLQVPRNVFEGFDLHNSELVLHTFSDASPKAYGAAVYLQINSMNKSTVNLVTAKSRVAPLKGMSLPRLELLGALLAARLANEVKTVLHQKAPSSTCYWTDSQITLYWIKGSATRWKSFVSNRVREIQTLTDSSQWFHCAGSENPADLLTRGIRCENLLDNSKWFKGPDFLVNDEHYGTVSIVTPDEDCYKNELKKNICNDSSVPNELKSLTLKFNSCVFDHILSISNEYLKLIRICSFVFRFLFNCTHPQNKRNGPLSSLEFKSSEVFLINSAQRNIFKEEFTSLENGKPISGKSRLASLNVFLDEKGTLRVGGRLSQADLPYSAKFPMILPSDHPLTNIIVRYFHLKYFHLGPQALLFHIRQKFWPINGRNICRRIVHECITCFKNKPVATSQLMADLPKERVNQGFSFSKSGVDYCGPFFIKFKNQRKGVLNKIYVVVYVCLCTKAIHLDFVSDLTTQAFIASLKRFFGRRGKCSKIMSDNSKTFVGADIELKKLLKMVSSPDENLSNFLAQEGIEWGFIPPKSPNFGGIWEAGVKSFKFHLKRVIGNQILTLEEFLTILAEIEGVLNSRPLTPLSTEIDNFEVLTPGHFLIGRPITSVPEPPLLEISENRLSKWQKIAKISQRIWTLWKRDYLNNLQERSKWRLRKNDVQEGTLVLLKQENLPSTKWAMGRITEIFKGKDNLIRIVNLRLPDGRILKRNVRDICILPIE